jgi:hypothetical protein
MKISFLLLFFTLISSFSQEVVTEFLLDANEFIGIDNLEQVYYIKDNTLYKKTASKVFSFSNLHLGKITSVDIINPMKIIVFYKDFNSVILLDDKLNELTDTIDFNIVLLKNISYTATASNSNLWLFSEDDNRLEIFNYQTQKTIVSKQLENDFKYKMASSNYHNFWLISDEKMLLYNEYGSFIKSFIPNLQDEQIQKLITYRNNFVFQTNNGLFYLNDENNIKSIPINSSFKIQNFSIHNNLLYFFDGKSVFSFNFSKK